MKFLIGFLFAATFSYAAACYLSDTRIESRKQGEDIGYQIGWEVGSNACYTHK